jgi:hypothetical protein
VAHSLGTIFFELSFWIAFLFVKWLDHLHALRLLESPSPHELPVFLDDLVQTFAEFILDPSISVDILV